MGTALNLSPPRLWSVDRGRSGRRACRQGLALVDLRPSPFGSFWEGCIEMSRSLRAFVLSAGCDGALWNREL